METNYDYDQRRLLEVHEKALQYNSTDFMSDPELMAISFGISLTNARILCYQVLENSQKKIKSITIEELTKIKGIGRRKATQIKSITDLAFRVMSSETRSMIKISRSSDIYEAVKFEFMGLEIEKFMVIYLT
jgi:DNA repair protein RadC